MSAAALAFGHWRAALRGPGLRLLVIAVVVAVAALARWLFADRVERALILQGAALMAADLVSNRASLSRRPGWTRPMRWRCVHAWILTFPVSSSPTTVRCWCR